MARYNTCPKRQREVQMERDTLERQQNNFQPNKSAAVPVKRRGRSPGATNSRGRQPRATNVQPRKKRGRKSKAEPETNDTQLDDSDDNPISKVFASNQHQHGTARRSRTNGSIQRFIFNIGIQQPVDEDRFFVIEKILDKRFINGREEYLIRWQNYTPEWDSWEPRVEIERNALDMINEYNRIRQPDDAEDKLHCICKRIYKFDQGGMIQCYNCLEWYHFKCLAMNMAEANSYAKWNCLDCLRANSNLRNLIKPEKRQQHNEEE